ncbi:MAG: permease prefix domain 1-containing protein [Oscillospiraceae bacterium]|nr:permease prefix domain 1-containing protein [Oscillospiraceae bacterium]
MEDRIQAHLNALFKDAPDTRRVAEAREELLAGCLDKYADLTAAGRSPEDAYIAVISGIGDVDELLRAIERIDAQNASHSAEALRKKRAFFIAAGVFLYILSLGVASILNEYADSRNAATAFLALIAAGTFVLIYGVISTRASVKKPVSSLTGEIQKQLDIISTSSDTKLLGAVTSSMWSLLVVVYLFIGFIFDWWHPGWLIFPFGSILQILLKATMGKKGMTRGHAYALIWTVCLFVYLLISFITDLWNITWIIFPVALCVQQMARLAKVWRESDET